MKTASSTNFEHDESRRKPNPRRRGIVDVWNAFMVEGAKFDYGDIPVCPSIVEKTPQELISWPEAKLLHKKMLKRGKKDYSHDAFVHFYVDDCKFDGRRCGIWEYPQEALKVLKHFSGVITPDFSTNQDFPEPIKIFATYRMRAFGYWLGMQEIQVVNNVRWGTKETWRYCFSGIPKHSIVSIGTVGGSPRKLCDRSRFETGFLEMLNRLEPRTIIVVGSANYPCFIEATKRNIKVIPYKSQTAVAFENGNRDE
ncbi:MAG: DUF4417 domain-containing protein [Coriobacteriales bacterium]